MFGMIGCKLEGNALTKSIYVEHNNSMLVYKDYQPQEDDHINGALRQELNF